MMTQEQMIRNFCVMNDGEIDFFLGAGASVQSGIPTGGGFVWNFKREIYCTENNISNQLYQDLKLPSTQAVLQDYFDSKGDCPILYSAKEYSYYFEKCYSTNIARKRFIESIVNNKRPSLGYLCMADLMLNSKIKNVWTTNFDGLLESAIHSLSPTFSYNLCSSANENSISMLNDDYPLICKLHGDYRYDALQNTSEELQKIEDKIQSYYYSKLLGKGLIVTGYSGNDESIMSFFENHIHEPDFLSKGLFWAVHKEGCVSQRVENLISQAKAVGKDADIFECDGFDAFLLGIYRNVNLHNSLIEDRWKDFSNNKRNLTFNASNIDCFIKLNAYMAEEYPKCNVFEIDICSWKELKACISDNNIIAALYSQKIYCFANVDEIKAIFKQHVKSEIKFEPVPERILYKNHSVYTGMIYQLIKNYMIHKGMVEYRKNKYFDPQTEKYDSGYRIYEAVEIALSYIDNKYYMNLLPTVHVLKTSGQELDKNIYQFQINKIMSKTYNRQYNEKLRLWENKIRTSKKMLFGYDTFCIEFKTPAVSCGGQKRQDDWYELPAWTYSEPKMCFSEDDVHKQTINQLKGLNKYGPIDCSYMKDGAVRSPIKLAVLAPKEKMPTILGHLNELNNHKATTAKDIYISNYEGFDSIFRRSLIIPVMGNKDICIGYTEETILSNTASKFLEFLKRGIDYFSNRVTDFNVLVIYIPRSFSRFREAKEISADFNLHDAIKLYATDKGVKVQFIEERSINTKDPCKVLWGLSTSIYAKASGTLWHPEAVDSTSAYVGISYAQSSNGVCIGCSQLFDSTGTGIRMLLRKIDNPHFYGKRNPYMGQDAAREMMIALREQYYRSNPTADLKRIVIHKTTPFMREEIIGITQAFEGLDNVELIQIQEYSAWRAIKFGTQASHTADGFPVKRGMAIQLSADSFLLWTHGCIRHPEIDAVKNYYKGGRGIPSPLLIKRYYGKSSGDVLAQEILMLTKMNWNSGDSLYKVLPVTLDFAKVLSRMSKQNEAIYNKAYDFRYFM